MKMFLKVMVGNYGGKKDEAQRSFQKRTSSKSKYIPLNHEIRTQAQGEICAKLKFYRSGKFILRAASKNFSCNLHQVWPSVLTSFCGSATSLMFLHQRTVMKNKRGIKKVNTTKQNKKPNRSDCLNTDKDIFPHSVIPQDSAETPSSFPCHR